MQTGKRNHPPSPSARPSPRILKILQCSNLGGMEQDAYSLLKEMTARREARFRIATPRKFGGGKTILKSIDPLCQDFEYKGKFGWRSFPHFQRHINSLAENADHIWITGTSACALAAVRRLPHKKVLGHHFHHFDNRLSTLRWFGFYQALCRKLDIITYPTDFTRNEALKIAPWLRKQAHVVRYGYPLSYSNETDRLEKQAAARQDLHLPREAFVVGNAGWLIPRKRFDVFLQTAAEIRERIPHAYFVICGDGPLRSDLEAMATRLGLRDHIRFTGWTEDTARYYQAWDLCLFNSDFDALGRTPMEAASHGCLVAASVRYGGLAEYLEPGKNGILLTDHNPKSLAREIATLATDPFKAQHFREAAAGKLSSHFSIEQSLQFYRSIFN